MNEQLLDELCNALRADDVEAVGNLLRSHAELAARINEPLGPFDSPIILAARSAAMLDLLLEAGADINLKSRWWAGGFGLLHLAPPELAAHAIQRGAVVDVHAAARLGLTDHLRALIEQDPSLVQACGGDGQTPLHFAANVEIARLLLDSGAPIDQRDVDHESTPAQHMVADRQEVARFLVGRGCQADLLLAAALGDLDLARRLLDADPECIRLAVSEEWFPKRDPRSGGSIYQWALGFHVTPHQVARRFGHLAVLRLLQERSPPALQLIDACWAHDGALARALAARHAGATRMLTEQDRRQPAHAARNNDTQAVQLLLELGFPVDSRGQHQGTPLHWAAFHGNSSMVRTILRYDPPLELPDADFQATPMGWATHGSVHGWRRQTGNYAGVVEALLRAGAAPPASLCGSPAVQEALRRHGSHGAAEP